MKPRIKLYIPASSKLQTYLEGLLELKLIADISVEQINWTDSKTGNFQDCSGLASRIHTSWEDTDGIVIWAPGKSVLLTAGYLSLVYPQPGIPLVCFSAPGQDFSGNLELGLKSLLINAVFLATSELAEVLILSGTKVMRPKQAVWSLETNHPALHRTGDLLAQVNYGLQEIKTHEKRSKRKPELKQPKSLENIDPSFSSTSWWVSLVTEYAFGLYEEKERAMEFIRQRV